MPGCGALVRDAGESRCPAHRRNRAAEAARPNAGARGYGASWRKIRAEYLAENPYCCDIYQVHGERRIPATEVDHIVALRKGGTNAKANLRGLCGLCHRRKTQRDDGGGFQPGVGRVKSPKILSK